MTLNLSLADALLSLIEQGMAQRRPCGISELAHAVPCSKDGVGGALRALQTLGVPIKQTGDVFSFSSGVHHLESMTCEHAHVLRAHVVDSSNTWLMSALAGDVSNGAISYAHKNALFTHNATIDWCKDTAYAVVPEFQTQGRGRHGRQWRSDYAQNALCSVAYYVPCAPNDLGGLSLACGAEIASRLNALLPAKERIQLKWPNDLIRLTPTYYDKLGGVLVERTPSSDVAGGWVVVGVGVNVGRAPELGLDVRNQASCIKDLSRQQVVQTVLDSVVYVLRHYASHGFAHWQHNWQHLNAFHKKNVLIEQACDTLRGICDGVDERGALLLDTSSGQKTLYSGDVSLRPDASF